MLTYLQTPAQQARSLRDRAARSGILTSTGSRSEAGSKKERTRRRPEKGEHASAERILNAGRRRETKGPEVGPEAERAAEFILSAEEPEDDVDEAVRLIKQAGRRKWDTRKGEGG